MGAPTGAPAFPSTTETLAEPMIKFVGACERLTGHVGLLAAWLVAPLIAVTVFEVFSRYVLDDPTIWAYEIGYMATGTNFMLGMAFTLREKGHIRIDVLFSRLSPKTQAVIDLCAFLFLLLPVSLWLSWALWNYAYDAYVIGETTGESAWNPIVWPFRMTFFAGFLVLSLQGIIETIRVIYILRDDELPASS